MNSPDDDRKKKDSQQQAEDESAPEEDSDHNESEDPEEDANSEDDDDDSDSESNDDDDEEGGISQYEKLRLERMKRNRERLAKLGLHSDEGGLLQKKTGPQRQRKKKTDAPLLPARSVPSRRTKVKEVNYAEPPNSVASLIRKLGREKPKKNRKHSNYNRDISQRMDKVVHREFQRLRSQKSHAVKLSERNVKRAQREIKYWTRVLKKKQNKIKKKEEVVVKVKALKQHQIEQKELGCTSKELIQEIDARMAEITQAADLYDQEIDGPRIQWEQDVKQAAIDNKVSLLSAIERFPRLFKVGLSSYHSASNDDLIS